MLNAIEKGADWPSDLLVGKGTLLLKDPETPYAPLSYRILMLLSIIYRLWAAARLANLAPWVESWARQDMYAGVKGRAAEDGWYASSLDMEEAAMQDKPIVGGAVDIQKCFDQIIRLTLYIVLMFSGFPWRVMYTYMRFHENMYVRLAFFDF